MDKLKEQGFTISVVVLALGLGALFYFWALSPYLDSSGADALGSSLSKLKSLNNEEKTPEYPTSDLQDAKEKRNRELLESLTEAEAFYAERKKAFDQFFSDLPMPPDGGVPGSAEFTASFQTKLSQLRERYVERFPDAAGDPADPNNNGLELPVTEPSTTEAEISRAMKIFWITRAIVEAAEDETLDIGGLKWIKFPKQDGRGSDEIEFPDHYSAIIARVEVYLPMSKLDPFVRKILQSQQVPFLLQELKVERDPMSLIEGLVKEVEYGEGEFPRAEAEGEAHPGEEPAVKAFIELWAVDWKGLPKKE